MTKICHTCKIAKAKSDFHKHNRNLDGLRSSCKDCTNKSQAKRDFVKRWQESRAGRSREDIHHARRLASMDGI